jgi:hypothetical protein
VRAARVAERKPIRCDLQTTGVNHSAAANDYFKYHRPFHFHHARASFPTQKMIRLSQLVLYVYCCCIFSAVAALRALPAVFLVLDANPEATRDALYANGMLFSGLMTGLWPLVLCVMLLAMVILSFGRGRRKW